MSSMVTDLLRPESLPDTTTQVVLVQTHISLVFVAERYVYKIKKPVNFGFLDFTSLESRRFYCQREIELNRRLTADLYLELLPVMLTRRGYSLSDDRGTVVDYAVKMRRIPEDRLMKSVFASGNLTAAHVNGVASVLADFHREALGTEEIDRYGTPEAFRINTDENFAQVANYVGRTIDSEAFNAIRRWTDHFYEMETDLFAERIRAGRIRDGHGDLHMEHVFLAERPQIFDCIEFNDRFRCGDTLADIAFLIMDLEYHGGVDHAATLWERYRRLAGEADGEALLAFYKVYRAFVRGKVLGFQLDDPELPESEKRNALERARRYFRLACSYIRK